MPPNLLQKLTPNRKTSVARQLIELFSPLRIRTGSTSTELSQPCSVNARIVSTSLATKLIKVPGAGYVALSTLTIKKVIARVDASVDMTTIARLFVKRTCFGFSDRGVC